MDDPFKDRRNPATCPGSVVRLLRQAMRHYEATRGNRITENEVYAMLSMKTYLEQPSEVWANYIEIPEPSTKENPTDATDR